MERKNAWNFYNEQDLAAVEELSIRYRRFLDAGKTERECAAESVRMAREAGYRDLLQMIHQGESLKPGDKVYISFIRSSRYLILSTSWRTHPRLEYMVFLQGI